MGSSNKMNGEQTRSELFGVLECHQVVIGPFDVLWSGRETQPNVRSLDARRNTVRVFRSQVPRRLRRLRL